MDTALLVDLDEPSERLRFLVSFVAEASKCSHRQFIVSGDINLSMADCHLI
jgi:hypothetical protein